VYGDRARPDGVTFDAVRIALQQSGPAIASGSDRIVTFSGLQHVTIQTGAVVVSDPVTLHVPDAANVVVSLFAADPTGTPTVGGSGAVSYVASGNHANDVDGAAFTAAGGAYFLVAVDVQASPHVKGAVVAIGDSITAGGRTAWPGVLASRLLAGPQGQTLSVLNVGVGGNRILSDSVCFDYGAVSRFDLDVLAQTGSCTVLMHEGVNDLLQPNSPPGFPFFICNLPATVRSAGDLIEGVAQLAARAHARGMRFIGGTITPSKDNIYGLWTPQVEVTRLAFNDWIRTTNLIDGYVDFAAAVADPTDPAKLAAQYNSGDGLHPNLAGDQAMANAVDLKLLRCRGEHDEDRQDRSEPAR
jgi:lysophospholipase L1-like esterase